MYTKRSTIIKAIFILLLINNAHMSGLGLNEAISENYKFNHRKAIDILGNLSKTPDVIRHLAWTHLKSGNYNKASELFLTLDQQNDYEILFGLGLSYYLQEDYKKSFEYFAKCLEANKSCAAAEYFRGEIKYKQGFFDESIKYFKNVLKLDYNFVEARIKLAKIYNLTKKYDDAFREWTSVVNIDPQHKEAQQNKEQLVGLISKKPEEIVPPQRITQVSSVNAVSKQENVPLLKIRLLKDVKEVKLWSGQGIGVYDGNLNICEIKPKEIFTLNIASDVYRSSNTIIVKPKQENSTIIIQDIKYASGFAWAGTSDREYRGFLEIISSPTGFTVINVINLEEYLYSVLPSEMISWWPKEALKTQAVIARTEAFYKKNIAKPHSKEGYDLCDDQHCQVYKGVKQETNSSFTAVDKTRAEVLEYKGKIAHALYSSNCSGHTQASKELKGWGDEPFLCGIIDGQLEFPNDLAGFDNWIKHPPKIFCAPSKYTYYAESRWIRVISQEEIKDKLNRTYKLGDIKKLIPLKRSDSGHINRLKIEGSLGDIEIEKENLIRAIAVGYLRSTNFIVESYGSDIEVPEFFIFWGAGWGHAVGLCQSGAAGMAEKGYKYEEILQKYYRNTEIKNLGY